MGGMNTAIKQVTGNEPDAYFSDLRNKNKPVIQGAKEAIWMESRTTLLNPKYIEALQQGGASSAEVFAETFRNTYGWDVMKSSVIDEELWDGLNQVYVEDKYDLGIREFFERENPYALQEMTAVMLETVRKGYWQPDQAVVKKIAELHAELVKEFKAGCSGFVCDNAKLREMISQQLEPQLRKDYLEQINTALVGKPSETQEGLTLEKQEKELNNVEDLIKENIMAVLTLLGIVLLFAIAVIWGVRRSRKENSL
jgi:cobaltochelatase CobN